MTGGNIRMNFRIHAIFLSLFFTLALCFSFGIQASAHDYERSDGGKTYTHSADIDVNAEDVENASAADKEEMTRKFLLHAVEHLKLIQEDSDLNEEIRQEKSRETVIFAKAVRDPGVFNHGNTYIIGITSRGATTNHARYQDLSGYRFDLETPGTIQALAGAGNISLGASPTCEQYTYDGQDRIACAIKQDTPTGFAVTTIAGFDHAEADLMPPDCSTLTLDVTAQDVEDETDLDTKRDLLEQYVKGFITAYATLQLEAGTAAATEDGLSPLTPEGIAATIARIYEKATCFREEQFYYGSIYPFIMDPVRGTSFMNALDFNLHGLSVSLEDPNPIPYDDQGNIESNVLVAFQRALTNGSGDIENDLAHGNNAFVTYHWDNPVKDGDEVANFLSMGVVPGTSIKESYLEVVNVAAASPIPNTPPSFFVFGSGIYMDSESMPPGDDMMAGDDGDGCSIAATGSTPQSTVLNLFLIASVLFSVVFLRKRS